MSTKWSPGATPPLKERLKELVSLLESTKAGLQAEHAKKVRTLELMMRSQAVAQRKKHGD